MKPPYQVPLDSESPSLIGVLLREKENQDGRSVTNRPQMFRNGTYGIKTTPRPSVWKLWPAWYYVVAFALGFATCTYPWWAHYAGQFLLLIQRYVYGN